MQVIGAKCAGHFSRCNGVFRLQRASRLGPRISIETRVARHEIVRNGPSGTLVRTMSTVVIYEADELMRALLEEWLSEAGYRVRAADAREAQRTDPADLVIVSIYMPKQAGALLVRRIQAAHPGAPLIALSGQFRSGLSAAGATAEALGVQQVIAKPLSRGDLLGAVRAMIPLHG